ncbi:sugar transporter ERD6-like 8 [Teleopsis dalmanni]|uniref:sugar transporter ERD6-like 8 n=1 Tax=Teleopsis dalmanni TaxID=139649 RepID=UPI0018CDB62D|nr:sugar transporter ERD6-like 8 [Teleopsis dalmanni]
MTTILIEPHSDEPNTNSDIDLLRSEQSSHRDTEPLQPETPQMRWSDRVRLNQPQSNSIVAAAFIFMSGGMHIAYTFIPPDTHTSTAWFVGAIIGTIIGSTVCDFLGKKLLFLLSACFVILGGVLLVSLPNNNGALLAGRYIDGFASGLLFAPLLVLAGEESVKSLRGMLAALHETDSFALGIFVYFIPISTGSSNTDQSLTSEQTLGIVSIFYGIMPLIIIFFYFVESPVYHLVHNDENQAIDSLRRLQRPLVITSETYQQLEEHKAYVAHNKEMSLLQSIVYGLPALLKLCLFRSVVALSFSKMTNYAFATASLIGYSAATWTLIVMGLLRWLGVLISTHIMDTVGRKKVVLIGAIVCGGMAIGIGIIMDTPQNLMDEDKMRILLYLYFVFQFFAGICIASSSAYLSEAFPLVVKPYYIGIAFIVELLVQIICLTAFDFTDTASYFYVTAAIFLALFLYGLLTLPETKHDTLLEAQIKFKQLLHSSYLN